MKTMTSVVTGGALEEGQAAEDAGKFQFKQRQQAARAAKAEGNRAAHEIRRQGRKVLSLTIAFQRNRPLKVGSNISYLCNTFAT